MHKSKSGTNTLLKNFTIVSNRNDDFCLYFELKVKGKTTQTFKIILKRGFQSLILLGFL